MLVPGVYPTMMRPSIRRLAPAVALPSLLLSATLLAGPLAPKAAAALVLRYDPPKAPPGTVVNAETVGGSGTLFRETPRLFLAPVKTADKIRTVTDARLSPIGELSFDDEGVGRLSFTVPDVAPGRYVAVVAARSDERGGTTAPDPFHVTAVDTQGGSPGSVNDEDGLPIAVLIVAVAAGTLAVTALVTRRHRHRASKRH